MTVNTLYDYKDLMIHLEECGNCDDEMDPEYRKYIDDHQDDYPDDSAKGFPAFEMDEAPDDVECVIMLGIECSFGK